MWLMLNIQEPEMLVHVRHQVSTGPAHRVSNELPWYTFYTCCPTRCGNQACVGTPQGENSEAYAWLPPDFAPCTFSLLILLFILLL